MTSSVRGLGHLADTTQVVTAPGDTRLRTPKALNAVDASLPLSGFAGQLLEIAEKSVVQRTDATTDPKHSDKSSARLAGDDEPQPSAEQWLLGMLGQQQVQIQARDRLPTAQPPDNSLPVLDAAPRLTTDARLNAVDLAPGAIAQPSPPMTGTALAPSTPNAGSGTATSDTVPGIQAPATPRVGHVQASALPHAGAISVSSEPARELPDSLLAALGEREDATTDLALGERQAAATTSPAERTLKLHAPEAKWGEQMLQALREQVELQLSQRSQNATIRLDPPELGSLEILLSHESGRLHVQLSAANADVARLLQQTSERLRQELVGQHFVQVQVQVGADGGQGQGQPRRQPLAQEQVAVAANPHEQTEQATPGKPPRDVLVTV